jgi:hypothetical protein
MVFFNRHYVQRGSRPISYLLKGTRGSFSGDNSGHSMEISVPLTVSVLRTDSGEECETVLPTVFLYADRESV